MAPGICAWRIRTFAGAAPAGRKTGRARLSGNAHASLAFRSAVGGPAHALAAGPKRSTAQRMRGAVKVNAVFERFTERAIKAVMLAQSEAKRVDQKEVGTVHILLGLIAEEQDPKQQGFCGTDVTVASARTVAQEYLKGKAGKRTTSEVPFSRGSKRVFEDALNESTRLGMNFIMPEHIVLALAKLDNNGVKHMFEELGVDAEALKAEASKRLTDEMHKEGKATPSSSRAGGKAQGGSQQAAKKTEENTALGEFCIDMTQRAADGFVDPVIGREAEVDRCIQILARRTKNNPILLGEPGVGKTAIAEGLALRITTGLAPDFLLDKRVMQLDIGLLMAGAKERGELESRITNLMQEMRDAGDVILMIDEVHTVVGAGTAGGKGGGGLDVSNMMKPALARGELQCIGATTLDEHRKYIEKDAALERRFQPVMVPEPTEKETVEILSGLRARYEKHHKCHFTDEAIQACVTLSTRYVADRFLPDKAIDLMDEAGSRQRMLGMSKKAKAREVQEDVETEELWRELKQVGEAKAAAVQAKLFEEAALLRDRELEVRSSLIAKGAITSDDELADGNIIMSVDRAHIESVAAVWTGIPVEQLKEDDVERLANMDAILADSVVGQKEAVNAVARSMRRARCGLKDPDRPIATMIFSGPTGVGKTELSKALAREYFGSEEAMVRLDMSEFMERHTVSKLVGAPPGYVGFGEGGTLTEAVRKRPFTIVLLDEVEKAHPDVFNILLQVMEDGRLTDSQGRTVSFKNTLLIMTSNIGSNVIANGGGGGMGFQIVEEGNEEEASYGRIKSLVTEEMKAFFRPEMLNRIDELVVFRQLQREDVRCISDIMLVETAARLQEQYGVKMELTDSFMQHLLDKGYDKEYGARPMRRAITELVEDALASSVLADGLEEGDTALFDMEEDGVPRLMRCKPGESCEGEPQIVFSSAQARANEK